MTTLYLNILGYGLLISSIFSITSTNPVISVIFLISTFVCSAGYLIILGIYFIGISYIVIYVGAIAVLFLFVIMMININITDIVETGNNYTKNFPLSIIIITLFIYIFKDIFMHNVEDINTTYYIDSYFNNFEQIQVLGHNLYTYGASLFIILSIILLLAMLAAIILSKSNNNKI